MRENDYLYFKNKLMQQKTYPYIFSNQPLAKEFYDRLKIDVPTARYYEVEGVGQVITHDRRAEVKLLNMVQKHINEHRQAEQKLTDLQSDLEQVLNSRETALHKSAD